MTISVDVAADLESRLLEQAARQGVDPGQYVAGILRARLKSQDAAAPRLDPEQSRLLEDVNRGLSQGEWDRYHALAAKRQSHELTGDELAELTAMSDRIEALNARRLEQLAELARLRGVTLPELLDQLGLAPPPVT